jgi:UDP-GlcNAc3NAcA epimerase
MKILTVVGARPQFIKAGAVSRVIRDEYARDISEIIIHTGQHYDDNMSGIFFAQLDIPEPRYNLEISGGGHGSMTGRMLEALERVFLAEKPDWVLIYGDTNSTLAAALAAAKLHVPVAHVEAGLRSFNMRMPEEVNRILADRVSSLLFCPTPTAVKNLTAEGINRGVHHVGDVMYDVSLFYADLARTQSTALHDLNLPCGQFALATCHRAENTDDPKRLSEIVTALGLISESMPVIFPVHPRTAGILKERNLTSLLKSVQLADPLPFLDMVALEQAAKIILTDSGGVQKEAFFYGVPCITMRDETEWVETVEMGGNQLCGADAMKILNAFQVVQVKGGATPVGSDGRSNGYSMPYGDGYAAKNILEIISG